MEISNRANSKPGGGGLLAILVTVLLLCQTDVAVSTLSTERKFADRLPEHFSAYYLKQYTERAGGARNAVLVVGDSVLWGYGVPVEDTAVAELRRRLPRTPIINAAFEAGTPINSDFLIRYLLAHRIYPRAILFDLNPLSFNQLAKSYDTLNPALESLAVPTYLQPFDDARLSADQAAKDPSVWAEVDRFLEIHWALYGSRVDIHQALFGDADAATALQTHVNTFLQVSTLTLKPAQEPSVPYAEMYDLTPLSSENVSFAYTQHFLEMLAANHIPAIAILPPTNHALLHNYIDVPAYSANLRRLEHLCHLYGATVLNLDHRIPQKEFIDNTHLTKKGNGAVAQAVAPAIAHLLHVF